MMRLSLATGSLPGLLAAMVFAGLHSRKVAATLGRTELGAAETARHSVDGGFRWVVMADPEGNAFCVAAPRD